MKGLIDWWGTACVYIDGENVWVGPFDHEMLTFVVMRFLQ